MWSFLYVCVCLCVAVAVSPRSTRTRFCFSPPAPCKQPTTHRHRSWRRGHLLSWNYWCPHKEQYTWHPQGQPSWGTSTMALIWWVHVPSHTLPPVENPRLTHSHTYTLPLSHPRAHTHLYPFSRISAHTQVHIHASFPARRHTRTHSLSNTCSRRVLCVCVRVCSVR